jgi:hypothetical protein
MLNTLRSMIAVRPRFWILTAAIASLILVLRFGLGTEEDFAADGGAMRAYISAISTLFGILAAFIIYVVWSQFIEADHAVKLEANELLDSAATLYTWTTRRHWKTLPPLSTPTSKPCCRTNGRRCQTGVPTPHLRRRWRSCFG